MIRSTVFVCLIAAVQFVFCHFASAAGLTIAGYKLGMSTQDIQATGVGQNCSPVPPGDIMCNGGSKVKIGGATADISFEILDGRVRDIIVTASADQAGEMRSEFTRLYGESEVVPIHDELLNSTGVTGAYRWVRGDAYLYMMNMDNLTFVGLARVVGAGNETSNSPSAPNAAQRQSASVIEGATSTNNGDPTLASNGDYVFTISLPHLKAAPLEQSLANILRKRTVDEMCRTTAADRDVLSSVRLLSIVRAANGDIVDRFPYTIADCR